MTFQITADCIGCTACVRYCPVQAISGVRGDRYVIDAANCIECGVCGRVCPNNAVVDSSGKIVPSLKRAQWLKPLFDTQNCVSCGMCLQACPVSCLTWEKPNGKTDLYGAFHAVPILSDPKKCIGCSFCAQSCPVFAIEMTISEVEKTK
jgi:formate hydrogenlyase subunit 6/NADH:ubiquinone oxidoreductase subunit I